MYIHVYTNKCINSNTHANICAPNLHACVHGFENGLKYDTPTLRVEDVIIHP